MFLLKHSLYFFYHTSQLQAKEGNTFLFAVTFDLSVYFRTCFYKTTSWTSKPNRLRLNSDSWVAEMYAVERGLTSANLKLSICKRRAIKCRTDEITHVSRPGEQLRVAGAPSNCLPYLQSTNTRRQRDPWDAKNLGAHHAPALPTCPVRLTAIRRRGSIPAESNVLFSTAQESWHRTCSSGHLGGSHS